jgi:hypothetical protein
MFVTIADPRRSDMRSSIRLAPLIPVLLAALAIVPVNAESRFGVHGGLQLAGVTYRPDFAFDHDMKLRPSWSAGVQWLVPVAALELETGLRYVEYGDKLKIRFDVTDGSYEFETHQVWRYVTVPALLRYRPPTTHGLFVSVGPEIGYLLQVWSHETIKTTGALTPSRTGVKNGATPAADIFEDVGTFNDQTRFYERWNLAVSGGLGLDFPIAGRTGEAQLRYTHGVLDIAKSDALRRETRGVEMLAGVRW